MPDDKVPAPKQESTKPDLLEKILAMSQDELHPWEDVILPSLGTYYDGAVPGGKIQVRPMTLQEDKILATQRLAQSGKSLDIIFQKCLKFPTADFDPGNLLAGDRVFLLYYLRGITHGNEYEYIVRCSNEECGQATTDVYDLNELSSTIKRPTPGLVEPFKIVLPHLSSKVKQEFWIKVRLLRGYDMQAMLNQKKVVRKLQGGRPKLSADSVDETLEENLNMLIVEAMGQTDRSKIEQLVGRLHASDTATIREFIRENTPGVDTSITVTCSACGNEMQMELPITESFFRPTKRGSTRE